MWLNPSRVREGGVIVLESELHTSYLRRIHARSPLFVSQIRLQTSPTFKTQIIVAVK